jgi:hypothetical protein
MAFAFEPAKCRPHPVPANMRGEACLKWIFEWNSSSSDSLLKVQRLQQIGERDVRASRQRRKNNPLR